MTVDDFNNIIASSQATHKEKLLKLALTLQAFKIQQ